MFKKKQGNRLLFASIEKYKKLMRCRLYRNKVIGYNYKVLNRKYLQKERLEVKYIYLTGRRILIYKGGLTW